MSQLKQEITLLSGIGQLSTTLLGTGLFMVPAIAAGIAAGIAGQLSLWAWLGLCSAVFVCLGWSMLYAVSVFAILNLPWKRWRTLRESNVR